MDDEISPEGQFEEDEGQFFVQVKLEQLVMYYVISSEKVKILIFS